MKRNEQQTSRENRVGLLNKNQLFLVFFAAAAAVIAGAAALSALFNPALAPSRSAQGLSSPPSLALAHTSGSADMGLAPDADASPKGLAQPREREVFETEMPGAPAAPRPGRDKAALAPGEDMIKSAKLKLAKKLAQQKLASTLLAARNRLEATSLATAAAPALAHTPAPLPSGGAPAQDVGEDAAEIVTASIPLANDPLANPSASAETRSAELAPEKPGAILAPAPGVKPQPPVRTQSRTAGRSKDAPKASAPALAYATPGLPDSEDSGPFSGIGKLFSGRKDGLPGRGSGIAVYDISAATVHMPDGTKLEAHSGIGHRMDNPDYTHVRNLGPTPPNIYDLRMRERRFHGVEAIRMLPHDQAAMKGRDGMLAHTPLLRRTNGSHGCVAFKDYNKFLKAFKAGKVKKMIVVPSIEKLPTYMAKLERRIGA